MLLVAFADVYAQTGNGAISLLNPEAGVLLLIISAFGVGLLLTFTPCVLPLIPIVSAIIVSQGDQKGSRMRGGVLSSIYVLGTIVTYAAIGAVAGATGDQLQAYFQIPWVIGIVAAVLVAGALSLFGLYEIRLPSSFETKMQESASRLGGGRIGTVFILGIVSALVVGACVTPLIISVLGIAVAKGDPLLGAIMMSSMAFGMGAVLIAIGFGLSYILPKTGAWMERMKHLLGVMLVALAIYLLETIPAVPVLFLWAAFLIVLAIYLGATRKLPHKATGSHQFLKGAGIVVLIWGVVSLIGAAVGNRDVTQPLPQLAAMLSPDSVIATAPSEKISKSVFTYVRNIEEFDGLLKKASLDNRPVLLDFYADWCLDCKRMDRTTFQDPSIVALLNATFTAMKVDVSDPNDDFGHTLRKRYSVFGPPALVLFDSSGNVLDGPPTYGYLNAEELTDLLSRG